MKSRTSKSDITGNEKLVDATMEHMRGQGYSERYLRLCRGVWREFLEFLPESSANGFSEDDIVRYLKTREICPESSGLTNRQRLIRAVVRILAEYKLHGCYQRRRCTAKQVVLSSSSQNILNSYETFCRDDQGCTPGTMRCRLRHITCFLHFLESGALRDMVALCPKHFSDFMRSQIHLKPKTLAVIVSDLRSFARFLCMEGVVPEDLSEHVPKVRVPRDARIPSVWSSKDVEGILTAVDRSSPKGKRDYAILMLACRLGLRVGDIRKLCLDNFDWKQNVIELEQAKTGVRMALPLSEEVGQAIVDYLQHGRPTTDRREVFLRVNAPIEPFADNNNLHHIITFYRQRAKVGLSKTGRKGLHSLRHSMATRLLEVGTPLETIASVMGHLSLESTQIYTKVDIDALRTAALEVEGTDE